MKTDRLDWNLIKSFLAVLDAGTLSGAAKATGISQPTLGRHIDELETAADLVLFERGRSGMAPTADALAIADEARAMQAAAASLSMAAANRETAVSGVIRITASEIVSTYILPPVLVALQEAEPMIEIELVSTNLVQNLLARDADIAVRMTRPLQNDLIARKVNDMAMGAYARRDYLDRYGIPSAIEDLYTHRIVGYDRSDLIESGMKRLNIRADRSLFRFRTDDQVAYWELVKSGAGIGFGAPYIARLSPDLVRVMPDLDLEPLPFWLASHRELKHSAKVRGVFDFLADHLGGLPLGNPTSEVP